MIFIYVTSNNVKQTYPVNTKLEAIMKIKFNESNVKNLEPEAKAYEATDPMFPGLIIRVQPTSRKTFFYTYRTLARQRSRLKIGRYGDVTLSQAKKAFASKAGDVANGKDPQTDKRNYIQKLVAEQSLTLSVYIEEHYKDWVLKNRKSGSFTLEVIDRHFTHLLDKPMATLTPTEIEKWQIGELDRGLNPATVNRNLTALRSIFTKAYTTELTPSNPLKTVKNLKELDDKRTRHLSPLEETKLFNELRKRNQRIVDNRKSANDMRKQRNYDLFPKLDKQLFADHLEPMVIIAIKTGIRKGELLSLNWNDINLNEKIITVRAANAKSSKVRHIPLSANCCSCIEQWRNQQAEPTGLVFKNAKGERFTDIKKSWSKLIGDAGITNFRFHDLRHHFASKLVMETVPLNTVREFLGHGDISTTLRYAHLAKDHKSQLIQLIDN